MPSYYTPFLGQIGRDVGNALAQRGKLEQDKEKGRLAYSAYMGDPTAMNELVATDPVLAMQVQEQSRKRKEKVDQQNLQKSANFKKEYDDIMENIAKFPSYEEAKEYGDSRLSYLKQTYPEIMAKVGEDAVFDEEDFNLAKQLSEKSGAFGGTSMDAQVSNMLTKGVEDPEFRNTPDYARAWQLANEPKIIRTPTGDIILRPELSKVFKPPGKPKPEQEQIADIQQKAEKDIETVPGTERQEKTTADEKLSFGYYNRMIGAEENISKLGDFNSADIWEQFKGLSNITASPELQQYRQAADDWIRAKLRRESGAVIAKSEMQTEYETYFPQIGDSQEVIDQKKMAREKAMNAMKIASGKEYKEEEKQSDIQVNESDLSVTIGGKKYKFPSLESLNKYREAAGI